MRKFERIIIISILFVIIENLNYEMYDLICSIVLAMFIVYFPLIRKGITGYDKTD